MPQAATLNSVLGPITPDQLGFTLMHEHVLVAASGLYQSYPDLLGVGPEARAIASLKRAKAAGIDSILDATTFDLGRHAPLLRAVSKASGVNIINVTGWWLDVPRFMRGVGPNQMAREFIRDITEGFRGKIDHSNDTTDLEYLQWILDQGCWLGLDRYPGRLVSPRQRTNTLKALIDLGHVARLCPSHDCICIHLHNERPDGSIPEQHDYYRGNPDQYLYIHRQVLPQLREMGVREADITTLFVDNPRNFLAAR